MASKVRGCKSFTHAVISHETFQLSTFPPILMDLRKYISPICGRVMIWPCGPTDKASDYESGDCRFESCQGQVFYQWKYLVLEAPSSHQNQESWTLHTKRQKVCSPNWVPLLSPWGSLSLARQEGKKYCAPGWARTTSLSVNSRTR